MILLFTTFLPYLFILYFIYRAINQPVFILGIPFLMFLGNSIFFEHVTIFSKIIFSFQLIEVQKNPDIFLLFWLVIFWVIFKVRNKKYSGENISDKYPGKNINILDYFIVFLMIITIIGFGLVLKEYYMVDGVYNKFIILISLFLGFFILKDVTLHTEVDVIKDFLFTLVIVNSIAAGLYFIHQGLHIQLYTTDKEYLTEIIDGETITRTFWFMPSLLFFSIAYLLVIKQSKSLINIILLLVNVMAVYISYTRTSLLIVILLLLMYYLLTGYKSRNIGKSIKSIIFLGVASAALFFVVSSLLPTSTKYFVSRFKDLQESPVDAHSNTLVYRFYKTGIVINKMDPVKVIFGYGSVTETQLPFMKFVKKATDDMAWAEIIFRWGYLGLILFFLLYIISLFKAFFLFMKNDGLISQLALLFLLMIFSQVIDSFTQATIMYPNRFPLSLWHFGILSALLIANNSHENIRGIEDELNES